MEEFKDILTDMEKDVIGEVMNISLGSSATSLSSLLSKRVEITVPNVGVTSSREFNFQDLEPAVGVEIKYVEGINGINVLVLKRQDIKAILESLMGTEMSDEEFQLDEIAMSAVCEVMNQMMGSAATALADFLGRTVNISTPIAFEITDVDDFKGRYFQETENIVQVRFDLKMGDVINSQFLNVLSIPLAKEMVSLFLAGTGLGGDNSEPEKELVDITEDLNKAEEVAKSEESEKATSEPEPEPKMETPKAEAPVPEPKMEAPKAETPVPEPKVDAPKVETPQQATTAPAPTSQPAPAPAPEPRMEAPKQASSSRYEEDRYDEVREREMKERRKADRMSKRNAEPVNVAPMAYESFDDEMEELTSEERTNLGLILSVPLQVSVEIGRTKKKIKEILDFTQGTIVELDKQAGSQVDIIINGQVIAKGDVVVVNDNFGVRVTEIVKKDEIVKLTM